ncbi:anti-sigma factor domain-containing protein [Bacillus sp. JJ1532]|uniref:anti-sigma factor domain-containing protein n=1 Tax=unclassified Bacillus (in: firmicutes) TaxID=185979 RepID=UPI002FFD7AA6
MKTGIIMEINERFLTLLTPEGEFLRAAKLNRQYEIGQEIDFYPLSIDNTNNRTLFTLFSTLKAKAIIAAAIVIILVGTSVFTFNGNNEVYAYMSIDSNSSIELAINDKFQVIDILPYNEKGEQIVKHIHDWKKKDIQDITGQIIKEIINQGYAKNNYEIVIATVNTKKDNKALETKLNEEITEIKENIQKEKLDVKVMDASPNDRKEAKEKGLSIGSYKETQLKKKTENNSGSHKYNKLENKKPDQTQKTNNTENEKSHNSEHSTIPPGQLKKEQDSNQSNKSDQANKSQFEKAIPPGQEKKEDRVKNNNGNKQENVNENKNKNEHQLEKNKHNNKEGNPSNQRGNGKEAQLNSKGYVHNKGTSNSNQRNGSDRSNRHHDNDNDNRHNDKNNKDYDKDKKDNDRD